MLGKKAIFVCFRRYPLLADSRLSQTENDVLNLPKLSKPRSFHQPSPTDRRRGRVTRSGKSQQHTRRSLLESTSKTRQDSVVHHEKHESHESFARHPRHTTHSYHSCHS